MRKNEYKNKFREFAGFIHDFSDPASNENDDEIARNLRLDWPENDRITMLSKLIHEAGDMLECMDNEWQAFSDVLNRRFDDARDARDWLEGVRRVWLEELARLRRGG